MSDLLIVASIVFSVAAIMFFLRKSMVLATVRLTRGKYSSSYLSAFRRYLFRNPYKHCLREEIISRMKPLVEKQYQGSRLRTKQKICFENQDFGKSFKEILKEYGEPLCFNAVRFDDPVFEIKVAGFPSRTLKNDITAIFYFIDNRMFMGEYHVEEPVVYRENVWKHMEETLDLKTKNPVTDNFVIENTRDQVILCKDTGFGIETSYFDRESTEVVALLEDYWNNMKERNARFSTNLSSLLFRS